MEGVYLFSKRRKKKKTQRKKNHREKKKKCREGRELTDLLAFAFGMKRSSCFLLSTFLQR
jgi:hypothetical protein